jgi:osmoprotectant transport system permease protein
MVTEVVAMSFLGDVVGWFTTGAHWTGDSGVPNRVWEHVWISGVSVIIALLIALPLGLALGHLGRGGFLAVNVSNVGRAIPSFGLLVLSVQAFGIGSTPAYIALVALAVPPIVTNSYVGVREVDSDVREAARGMGMSGTQMLVRVETPMALPLVMAGVRTAAVQVVATATLAALVGSGGLGRYIVLGLATQDRVETFAGGILVALLAMLTEVVLGLVERRVTPSGIGDGAALPLAPAMPATFPGV